MKALTEWLRDHITDSEKLHAQFLAECNANDYSDLEQEIRMREEAGFLAALRFVLRHVTETE